MMTNFDKDWDQWLVSKDNSNASDLTARIASSTRGSISNANTFTTSGLEYWSNACTQLGCFGENS